MASPSVVASLLKDATLVVYHCSLDGSSFMTRERFWRVQPPPVIIVAPSALLRGRGRSSSRQSHRSTGNFIFSLNSEGQQQQKEDTSEEQNGEGVAADSSEIQNEAAVPAMDKELIASALLRLSQTLESLSASVQETSAEVKLIAQFIQRANMAPTLASSAMTLSSAASIPASAAVGETELTLPEPYEVKEEGELNPRHKLVFRLQRAFVQARIEGLGKPTELALEDMVDACVSARQLSLRTEDVQLDLILADASLPPEFSPSSSTQGRMVLNPFTAEESRIRALWVRIIFSTLEQAERMKGVREDTSGRADIIIEHGGNEESGSAGGRFESDPMDAFVVETIRAAVENGKNLAAVRAEQAAQGPAIGPSVQMMRQSQLLILLALDRAGI
eukprot:TRINITY_DN13493_c0_g1_i1.p1 TRINITY_DN13493_c0_g1~~TRINITY_DN13493_c0_g1_i1.p1  ORF type:complete len:390 (+),score=104.87 TRINITY_DN13493_c0_g1_i1:2-1171(+)